VIVRPREKGIHCPLPAASSFARFSHCLVFKDPPKRRPFGSGLRFDILSEL
jgi:hypothetical protein